MDTSLPSRPLVTPVAFLSFVALCQTVLGLWVMDRIGVTAASSILLGFVLFCLLARAVRDVMESVEQEQRALGARRVSR